jgi:hypothetical protein
MGSDGEEQVDIHWENTPNNETSFQLQRSADGGAYADVATIAPDASGGGGSTIDSAGADVTSFIDHIAASLAGEALTYQVQAKNATATSHPATTQTGALTAQVVIRKTVQAVGHPWSYGNTAASGENGNVTYNGNVVPDIVKGQYTLYIDLDSADITIDATTTNVRGTYGHEQRHILAVEKALSSLANEYNGHPEAGLQKLLSQKIAEIIQEDSNHTLPGDPTANSSDYAPLDGIFPAASGAPTSQP